MMNFRVAKSHLEGLAMTIFKHVRLMLMLAAGVVLSATPVYAEDIEIYLVPGAEGGANVLLLIDTSGGTNRNFPGTADPNADGKKTIDQIAYALQQVVQGLAGTARVGISSQQSGKFDGGMINYPVAQIDETVQPSAFAFASSTDDVPRIDAQQSMSGGFWKPIDVASDTLQLPPRRVGLEELHRVAFILNALEVPRYAVVTEAVLKIATPTTGSGDFKMVMAYERNRTPELFSPTADLSDDTTGRKWSDLVGADVKWGDGVVTADVTSVVQAAVADPFWCGNAPMSLMIDETNASTPPSIYSLRAEIDEAPLGFYTLEVKWSSTASVAPPTGASVDDAKSCMGGVTLTLADGQDDARESASGTSNLKTDENTLRLTNVTTGANSGRGDFVGGLRFANVPFGNTASIDRAELFFRVVDAAGTDPQIVVRPMLGNTPAFGSFRDRTTGTATAPAKVVKGQVNSIDVTAQVAQILAGAGWNPKDAMGLRLERHIIGTSLLEIAAVEGGVASAAYIKMDVLSAKPTDFVGVISRRNEMMQEIRKFSNAQGGGNNMPATSYLESALYMLGRKPVFDAGNGHPEAFIAPPSRDQYLSPVAGDFECGGNHIILVTHADPSGDKPASPMNTLTGDSGCPSDNNSDGWTCMANVAKFLQDADRNGLNVPITTHTVAFAPQKESTYDGLAEIAKAGGGKAESAETAAELAAVLSDIIDSLTTTSGSMAAPGVAVNQLNRFQHLDELYYALFKPELTSTWEGNLKRYRLDFAGNPPAIVDVNGVRAVDPLTGFFRESASSWWLEGTLPDGGNVDLGGARAVLDARAADNPRRLYLARADLSVVAVESSDDVTAEELGLNPAVIPPADLDDEVQQLVDYLLVNWGDPLHSEPRLVNYGFTGDIADAALDSSLQDNTVFATTNGGMLHAIDPVTGKELFAFMPGDEMKKTALRRENLKLDAANPKRKTYGLDGGISVWRRAGAEGKPEHVYLYLAQRRGGRNYYAVDATDRNNPKMLWQIRGGVGDFADLGQTWSQPTFSQVLINGVRTPVLVFAGGYSPADHDDYATFRSGGDLIGKSVFIVDARTGALIRRFSVSDNSDMKWAMPNAVAVVDMTFNGIADHIYVGDMAGQIFRIDLNKTPDGDGLVDSIAGSQVVTVARLGATAEIGIVNHRRFYAAPTIGFSRIGGKDVLQVAIGSGYRAHPLSMETLDRIYIINDIDALNGTATLAATPSDLENVTDLAVYEDPSFTIPERGWRIDLTGKGEKVMSSAVISDGKVFFTTYLPESAFINKCQRVVGSSRLYAMNILDGRPVQDFNNDGTLDRFTDLILPGLPPSPQLLLGPDGQQVLLIGTSAEDIGTSTALGLRKKRWFEVPSKALADQALDKAFSEEDPIAGGGGGEPTDPNAPQEPTDPNAPQEPIDPNAPQEPNQP
jgi:type IV pilus assembly protein PilY1